MRRGKRARKEVRRREAPGYEDERKEGGVAVMPMASAAEVEAAQR